MKITIQTKHPKLKFDVLSERKFVAFAPQIVDTSRTAKSNSTEAI